MNIKTLLLQQYNYRDHSYNWCMHGKECVNISPSPLPISSIVRHANELWLSPNFPRLCWLSAILQTCQLSHFWTVPLFELAKEKKRDSLTFLTFQWWQISLNEQQRMMSILHGIFTSAFSLFYCDRFSYEKPSLSEFFLFLVMYMHRVLAQCSTYW